MFAALNFAISASFSLFLTIDEAALAAR